jgi:hypothetical protein
VEYRINELSLGLPDTGWRDASSHRLESKAPDGSPVTLEIYRHEPVSPERLAARVASDLAEHRRALRGFELLAQEEFHATDVDGISTSFRTVTADGAEHHEIAYLPLADVLLIVLVTGVAANQVLLRDLIVGAIESVELRARPAPRRG